jgi:hypothetical protein
MSMTYPQHIAPFLRSAAGDVGALPEREHHDGETQPMEVDEPIERPFSDEFDEEPTAPGLRAYHPIGRGPALEYRYDDLVGFVRERRR